MRQCSCKKLPMKSMQHYQNLQKISQNKEVTVNEFRKIKLFTFIARIVGLVFSLRWMEAKEADLR